MSAIKAGLIMLICLAAMLRVNSQDEQQTTLMDIFQAILNDPQFLELNNQDQLRLLVMIYNMLESHLKEQENDEMKKRSTSSRFLRELRNF